MSLSNNNISYELREIAPAVADIGINNPYAVPMGYFDELADNIMKAIRDEGFSNRNPYSLPDGYFTGLANSILQKVKTLEAQKPNEVFEELKAVAPLLNTISKENILFVPENYFGNLNIKAPVNVKPAKVISIGNNIRKWVTYAAAASILFILSTTSYLYINHHMKTVDRSLTIGQRLATLDDAEILNYLQNNVDDFDPNTASSVEEDSNINHLLINASDEEIENYLDASNSDNGEETVKGI